MRLDNSHPDVLEFFKLNFDEDDPGATEPVDICPHCRNQLPKDVEDEVAHPSYEDDVYFCQICGELLEEGD